MEISREDKEIIKQHSTFLLNSGYLLYEDEFLEFVKKDIKIQIAYSYQEGGVNVFFQEPYSCFSVGWLSYYLEKNKYEEFIKVKREKLEHVIFELDFLKNNFENLTNYDFCKKTQNENQMDISDIDPNSFDL